MTLNCIIIDDDPRAGEVLTDYVSRTPFLELVGTYDSAVSAIKDVKTNRIDLAFLDIRMPDLGGLEFATILPKTTKIVFTTAFEKYAIDSFKVNTIDYLIKPVSYESFLIAATKALMQFQNEGQPNSDHSSKFIFVKSDYKIVRIALDELIYVEGVKDYVKFVLDKRCNAERPEVLSLLNIKHLEDVLPKTDFMRVHRSYIVNKRYIRTVERSQIVFDGDVQIPISETYRSAVQSFLNEHLVV